ncbi:FAD dependent oxidoreductase [Niveomyces insectorum RCEF 264]|uniref:Glycerol-3-phosphate dehydrogenase n=1 Tax=Niveomyces insectorum RCEF 264 TaxID=1081102 RepID=A0A167W817_9HYPO|nr:FAD dependent oxidoreductase [Niveomyces insectorum RCEF 264]
MAKPFSRIRRPLLVSVATAVTAVAAGGGIVYATRKNRSAASLSMPTVPLKRDTNGRIRPPVFPTLKSRAEQLAELRRSGSRRSNASEDEYDLLIVGGGATGTGIALDAATRGLKVALVERDDFSAGSSSRSTKLVHGGVRYLEKAVWNVDYGQLQLVIEALSERRTFLNIAPHLSSQLPIMLPLQHWWQVPYFWVGTKAYDLLAGSQGLDESYWMSRVEALKKFPLLRADNLVGGLVYYDGQQNDSRTNVSLALTAMLYGATAVNHVEVVGLEKDAGGRICGARVRDVLNDDASSPADSFVVRAKGVINATGPFTDALEHMDNPARPELVAPSSGAHIVLPGNLCPNGMGLIDAATSDGRVVFVLPWEGHTLAGTTDAPCTIERDPMATQDEVNFILKEVGKMISPAAHLSQKDILAAWSVEGIRPLVRNPHSKNTESLVRSHLVTVSPSGLLTCAGGKWTTYRQMAEDAVDKAIETFHLTPRRIPLPDISGAQLLSDDNARPTSAAFATGKCLTKSIQLIGAHGYSPQLPAQLREVYPAVDADIAEHLARNYGDRAWAILSTASTAAPLSAVRRLLPAWPITEAEIRHGVRSEAACTAADVLSRRTRLAFVDVDAARQALPRIIDIMAEELDWSEARRQSEWEHSLRHLESMGLGRRQAVAVAKSKEVQGVEDAAPEQVVGWAVGKAAATGVIERRPAAL